MRGPNVLGVLFGLSLFMIVITLAVQTVTSDGPAVFAWRSFWIDAGMVFGLGIALLAVCAVALFLMVRT